MWRRAVLLVSCILLAGCSKTNAGLSPSVIKNLPPSLVYFASEGCQAPCWQGIAPGTTDRASAKKSVYEFIHSSASWNDGIFFNGYNEVGYSVELFFSGEKVRLTRILPSENKPRLGEVIDLLGRPERVCLNYFQVPDSVPTYRTDIVYLKRGIWLSSDAEFTMVDNHGHLSRSLDFNQITFFNPREKFNSLGGDRTDKIMQCAQKWKGFTRYEYQSIFFDSSE